MSFARRRTWPRCATLAYLLLAERRALTRGGVLRFGIGLALGLVAAVPVLWPYLQITREFGSVRSLDEVVQWSGVPRLYLGINPYNFTWSALLRPWSGGNPERFLFPGLVAPLLALLGLLLSRRRTRLRSRSAKLPPCFCPLRQR